ncbi:MAG: beta-lactamase family protein [Alphaproteobacteria bacterium]|nr:beta-lactamase family protein [Alphaproteobacteria bacterium]
MNRAPDRYRYVLGAPVVIEPGTRWIYSGGATALLARILAEGTGQSLQAFAREALFDPLGIGATEWFTDDDGEAIAASGLRMTPRDLARIGQLMLNGGMRAGRCIVPAQWIERSTSPAVDIDEIRQYGYHWYLVNSPSSHRRDRAGIARASTLLELPSAMAVSGSLYCPVSIWSWRSPPAITMQKTSGFRRPA